MELDERKFKILEAVIRNYLITGEPVGSRTISKIEDICVSSATIRNEMADLEDMGYIIQPHTSAGRVPTDKGYRIYVDSLLRCREEELKEIDLRKKKLKAKEEQILRLQEEYNLKMEQIDVVMKTIAKSLADNTNYATVISSPKTTDNIIKFLQLSRIENNKLLVVIVLERNTIRNKVFSINENITDRDINKINMLLNTTIVGLSVNKLKEQMLLINRETVFNNILYEILTIVLSTIQNTDDLQIYTSGTTNIFKYPELSNTDIARALISTFEEKNDLEALITKASSNEGGIQFYIGEETSLKSMTACSVVTATYELGGGISGTIGIIGPKRMDYEMVVETLSSFRNLLDDLFEK